MIYAINIYYARFQHLPFVTFIMFFYILALGWRRAVPSTRVRVISVSIQQLHHENSKTEVRSCVHSICGAERRWLHAFVLFLIFIVWDINCMFSPFFIKQNVLDHLFRFRGSESELDESLLFSFIYYSFSPGIRFGMKMHNCYN